jgi:hypothetical protein
MPGSYWTHSDATANKKEVTMNTVLRSGMYLPMAAMILTAIAVPMTAGDQVPFKGSIQGHESDIPQGGPPPTTLSVDGSATGIGTHVGQFSFTYHLTVTLANGTATGTAQLIAANGDSIYSTVAGSSNRRRHPVSPALRKSTPLRMARVDSPEPKGASRSSA